MSKSKIKICGLTCVEDVLLLNKYQVEYAGFVLFYEKSKRYNTLQNTWNLIRYLDPGIKKVAVTVSPTVEQIEMIMHMDFDYLQVHGDLTQSVAQNTKIPILQAINVKDTNPKELKKQDGNIAGYVLDGKEAGSGVPFDWKSSRTFDRNEKLLFLAGGLNAENVLEGIKLFQPDVVDVSSGVEGEKGKSEEKIKAFVGKVRGYEQ